MLKIPFNAGFSSGAGGSLAAGRASLGTGNAQGEQLLMGELCNTRVPSGLERAMAGPCHADAARLPAATPESRRCRACAARRAARAPGRVPGSCSGCVRVFPTAPNDLICRGLKPEPSPHRAGCCAEPSFPKVFRDRLARETPGVWQAEGPPAQRCPHAAAMGLLGRGQAAWQGTTASSPLPRAARREAGKSRLESLI